MVRLTVARKLRPEKFPHPPAEKSARYEKTTAQKEQTEHPHCASDVRTVGNSIEKGVDRLGDRIVFLLQRQDEAVAYLQHSERKG